MEQIHGESYLGLLKSRVVVNMQRTVTWKSSCCLQRCGDLQRPEEGAHPSRHGCAGERGAARPWEANFVEEGRGVHFSFLSTHLGTAPHRQNPFPFTRSTEKVEDRTATTKTFHRQDS